MDTKKWETILLRWIAECGFVECHLDIAQCNVETFFQKFSGFVHLKNKSVDLVTFLKEQYPRFQPHFSVDRVLCTTDYVYVYSLLLHFSCVKYPETYFQDICQKLPVQQQQCIVAFFKHMLDCIDITNETIHRIIIEVINSYILPSPSLEYWSPVSKQIQWPALALNPSVSSPEHSLLEDRTRELYSFKALLETERYQNEILEKQINQSEEKTLQLHKDYVNLQQQMQDLKNDIITMKKCNDDDKQVNDEQIKKKYYKIISQKEEEISNLRGSINTSKDEKDLLQQKLNSAEEKIFVCLDHINEWELKVDELSEELKNKNGTIELLTENRLELEQFIAELRANAESGSNLNVSLGDFLDISSSFENRSFQSERFDNNLACSVIDVQLREKEIETKQLRKSLDDMRLENYRLAKKMNKIALHYAKKIRIEQEKVRKLQDIAVIMRKNEEKRMIQLNQAVLMLRNMLEFFKKMPHSKGCINLESDKVMICFQDFGKVIIEELKSFEGMI